MRKTVAASLMMGLASVVAGGASGCDRSDAISNRSPTPEQDPERHARATRYSEELVRKQQEAERKAMSRRRSHAPEPSP